MQAALSFVEHIQMLYGQSGFAGTTVCSPVIEDGFFDAPPVLVAFTVASMETPSQREFPYLSQEGTNCNVCCIGSRIACATHNLVV